MAPTSTTASNNIRTLDFDTNRTVRSHNSAQRSLLDDDVDFIDEVAEGILERDRKRMRMEVLRIGSFISAVLCWYAICACEDRSR